MALPSSGQLSLDDIQTEFGGSNPIGLSEYYGVASGVPSSGTIDISDFYGTSATATGQTMQVREDAVTNASNVARRVGFQLTNGGDFHHPEVGNYDPWSNSFGSLQNYNSLITGGSITGITLANYDGSSISSNADYLVAVISTDRTTDGGWSSCSIAMTGHPTFGNYTHTLNRTSASGFSRHSRLASYRSTTRYKWYYIIGTYSANSDNDKFWSSMLYQATNSGSATINFS